MGTLIIKSKYWTPLRLNPSLWLDANDSSTITTVSGAVSEWRDKSGNNRHATQATASNRPLLVSGGLNGTDVIRFSNNNWVVVSSNFTIETIFVVFKTTANIQSFDGIYSMRVTDGNIVPSSVSSVTSILLNHWDTLSEVYGSSSVSTFNNGLEVLLSTKTSPYSNTQRFFATVPESFNISCIQYPNTGAGIKYFMLGGDTFSTARYFNGDIAQIIIFHRVLTQAEREQIEGYLAWSTGLTTNLPNEHPFKNKRPRN